MMSLQAHVRALCVLLCVGSVLLTVGCSRQFDANAVMQGGGLPQNDLGSVFDLKAIVATNALNEAAVTDKVVYLDFWASWCAPCIQSLPVLNDLRHQYAESGFELISVNVDVEPEKALAFIEKLSLDFPVLHDPEKAVMREFEVTGLPTGILLNAQSEIILIHRGFAPKDEAFLRARIDREVRRQRFNLKNTH